MSHSFRLAWRAPAPLNKCMTCCCYYLGKCLFFFLFSWLIVFRPPRKVTTQKHLRGWQFFRKVFFRCCCCWVRIYFCSLTLTHSDLPQKNLNFSQKKSQFLTKEISISHKRNLKCLGMYHITTHTRALRMGKKIKPLFSLYSSIIIILLRTHTTYITSTTCALQHPISHIKKNVSQKRCFFIIKQAGGFFFFIFIPASFFFFF